MVERSSKHCQFGGGGIQVKESNEIQGGPKETRKA